MTAPYAEPRVFRDLCPDADERDGMDDDEFWQRVNRNLGYMVVDVSDDIDQDRLDDIQLAPNPCPVCGSTTACGYDSEGQAMIHAVRAADGE